MSDEAVKKATGKTWPQWFAILDKAGAKKMAHIDIAKLIYKKYLGTDKSKEFGPNVANSGGWWSQMVTVVYEQARGMRTVNQYAQGYLVSVHKTVSMPVSELVRAWSTIEKSKVVAAKKLERIPSKTQRKMLRYKAAVGGVVVMFDERGKGKSRIMVEATRLPEKSNVERERAFWKKVLGSI